MRNRRQQAHRYGLAAEKIACWYLRLHGYRIIAERYRNAQGEIDIVARRGTTLVAVEVKARRNFDLCAESITLHKQRRIARAVEGLLARGGQIAGQLTAGDHTIRFDALWIVPWRLPRHIKDAWRV